MNEWMCITFTLFEKPFGKSWNVEGLFVRLGSNQDKDMKLWWTQGAWYISLALDGPYVISFLLIALKLF